jgi:hypothetical protein
MLDKVTKEMEAEGTQMATAKRSSPSMFSKLGNWLMYVPFLFLLKHHAPSSHEQSRI